MQKPPQQAQETTLFSLLLYPCLHLPQPQIHLSHEKPKSCSPEVDKDPHSHWSLAPCLQTAPMPETSHPRWLGE